MLTISSPFHVRLRNAAGRLRRAMPLLLLGAAGLLAQSARADVITFDGIGDGMFVDVGQVTQAGYSITVRSPEPLPPYSLVGVVVDGSYPNCYQFSCPASSSNYLTSVNGSKVDIARDGTSGAIKLSTFDAVFGGTSSSATLVRVSGMLADHSVVVEDFTSDGSGLAFQHFAVDAAFAGQQFIGLSFSGLSCGSGTCVAASQFGLDNITMAVPEPSTYLMLGIGLLMVVGAVRRQRKTPALA